MYSSIIILLNICISTNQTITERAAPSQLMKKEGTFRSPHAFYETFYLSRFASVAGPGTAATDPFTDVKGSVLAVPIL